MLYPVAFDTAAVAERAYSGVGEEGNAEREQKLVALFPWFFFLLKIMK